MSASRSFAALVDDLPNSQNKQLSLENIKVCLSVLSPTELYDTTRNVSYNVIFECLDSSVSEEIETCCYIIEKLLGASDATTILHQFHFELLQGLSHPNEQVKFLCLKQIDAACNGSAQQLVQYEDVICRLLGLMGEELELASRATDILIKLGGIDEGLEAILSENCFDTLQRLMDRNDTVRYRVYQMVVDLSVMSPTALSSWETCGILSQLLNDVYKDDILVQINCLDLLTELNSCLHGLEYLEQKGVISTVETMMSETEDDPMKALLVPGLIKFCGHLGKQHPKEVNGRLEAFMNTVFSNCDSIDLTLRIISIETVAYIGSSPEGKRALQKLGNKMTSGVQSLGNTILDSTKEYRLRAIDAATRLFTLPVSEQTEELLESMEQWFNQLHRDPFKLIENIVKLPIVELKCAGFSFLKAIAILPWAQKQMNDRPGFTEYLLDRSTENHKEGKECKFDVVRSLTESPTALDIFGRVYHMKLREHVNEGAFYVRTETQVAFEGE